MVTPADAPWIAGGLSIARAVLEAVEAEALAAYARDEEACGYLVGPAADGLSCDGHVAMPNLANKLHALDPATYFRTGRMFFAFNEKKFDDAVRAGAAAGRPVKVLYHSHLDAGAYFSPTDAAVMSMGEPPAAEGAPATMGPGPAWPLAFLVTSVEKGAIVEHRLFVWAPAERAFQPSTFRVD
jgi:[CysO sulfur-carrier protein]-S-L-cysteine hydrolase